MVEIGCHGSIASGGEPIHHGTDKGIDTSPVLDHYNGGKRPRATGHGDVQSHILVANLDTFRQRWHTYSSPWSRSYLRRLVAASDGAGQEAPRASYTAAVGSCFRCVLGPSPCHAD